MPPYLLNNPQPLSDLFLPAPLMAPIILWNLSDERLLRELMECLDKYGKRRRWVKMLFLRFLYHGCRSGFGGSPSVHRFCTFWGSVSGTGLPSLLQCCFSPSVHSGSVTFFWIITSVLVSDLPCQTSETNICDLFLIVHPTELWTRDRCLYSTFLYNNECRYHE